MAGHVLTDFIVVNYTQRDRDDCIHFLTHINPNAKRLSEMVSPTAKCVYTSAFNAWYLRTYFQANPKVVIGMESERSYKIEIKGKKCLFAFIDSRYSTGSVMIILRGSFGTLLYTGFFSFHSGILMSPILRAIINRKALTKLFLDTTYYEQVTGFRSMAENIMDIVNLIRESKPMKIYIYLEGFGLEHVLIDVARSLNESITVDARTMMILSQLKMAHLFTHEKIGSRIFVTSDLVTTRAPAKPGEIIIIVLERITAPTQAYSSYTVLNNTHTYKFYCHPTHAQCCTMISKLMAETLIPIGLNNLKSKIIYKQHLATSSDKPSKSTSGDQNFFHKQETSNKCVLGHNSRVVNNQTIVTVKEVIGQDTSHNTRPIISEVIGHIQSESVHEVGDSASRGFYPVSSISYIRNIMRIQQGNEILEPERNTGNIREEQSYLSDVESNSCTKNMEKMESSVVGNNSGLNLNLKQTDERKCNGQINLKIRNVDEINKSVTKTHNCSSQAEAHKRLNNVPVNTSDMANFVTRNKHFGECVSDKLKFLDPDNKFVEITDKHLQSFNKSGHLNIKNITGVCKITKNRIPTVASGVKCNVNNCFDLREKPSSSSNIVRFEEPVCEISQINSQKPDIKKQFVIKRKYSELHTTSKRMRTNDSVIQINDADRTLCITLNNVDLPVNKSHAQDERNNLLIKKQGENYGSNSLDNINKNVIPISDIRSSHPINEEAKSKRKNSQGLEENIHTDEVPTGPESVCQDPNCTNAVITAYPLLSIDPVNSKQPIDQEKFRNKLHQVVDNEHDLIEPDIEEILSPTIVHKKQNNKNISDTISEGYTFPVLGSKASPKIDENVLGPLNKLSTVEKSLECPQKSVIRTQKSVNKNLNSQSAGNSLGNVKSLVSCNGPSGINSSSKNDIYVSVHKIIAISDGDNSSPSLNTGSEILLQVQPTASDKRIDSEYSNNLVNNTVTINSIEQHGSKDDSDNNKEMSYNEYLCTTARIHTFDKSDSNHIINTEQYISNMEKTKLSIEDDRVTEINHSELRNDFVTKKSCPETRHLEQLGDYPESNSKLKCINEVESNIVNEDVCNSQSVSDTTISEPTHEIENGENSSSFPRNNGFNLQVSEVRSDESSEEESYSNTRFETSNINTQIINDIIGINCHNTSVVNICNDSENAGLVAKSKMDNCIDSICSVSPCNKNVVDECEENGFEDKTNSSKICNLQAIPLGPPLIETHQNKKQTKHLSGNCVGQLDKTEERQRCHRQTKLPSFISEAYVVGNIAKSTHKTKKVDVKPASQLSSEPGGKKMFNSLDTCETSSSSDPICRLNPYVLLDRNYLKIARYTYSVKSRCFIPCYSKPKFRGTFIRRNYNKGGKKNSLHSECS